MTFDVFPVSIDPLLALQLRRSGVGVYEVAIDHQPQECRAKRDEGIACTPNEGVINQRKVLPQSPQKRQDKRDEPCSYRTAYKLPVHAESVFAPRIEVITQNVRSPRGR